MIYTADRAVFQGDMTDRAEIDNIARRYGLQSRDGLYCKEIDMIAELGCIAMR